MIVFENRIRDGRTEDRVVLVAEYSLRVDRHAVHVALLDRLGSQMGRYFIQQHTKVPLELGQTLSRCGFFTK